LIADVFILALPRVSLRLKDLLPENSGVYYVLDETNTVWYIGKAKNLRKRWQGKTHHRIIQLQAQRQKHFSIYYEQISEFQLDNIEKQQIAKYQPHLNNSPVKTKNVRPTETLLRETLAAIAPFAFILGVEPPRKAVVSQINDYPEMSARKLLLLDVIHICLDDAALQAIYQPESIEETLAIATKPFGTRKVYASKWDSFSSGGTYIHRLLVNGHAIEVTPWSCWCPKNESEGLRDYQQTSLIREPMNALTPESLSKLQQQQSDISANRNLYLQRLNPYTSDPLRLLFEDQTIDRKRIRGELEQISEDYKARRRGIGSRFQSVDIQELLNSRGVDVNSYPGYGRIELCVHSFSADLKAPYRHRADAGHLQAQAYNLARGIRDGKEVCGTSANFDPVYLLASVDLKAWLLVEEYLQDFARPATGLGEGEAYVKKFYTSARKYILPAKVNLQLTGFGYSTWIPFGPSGEFTTYESATEAIRQRLLHSGLPDLKVTFKREAIAN
jgi:predicted GIY-YIG superfamily endonuclease